MTELTLEVCRREIEELHEFFVDWYAGGCDRTRFTRLEDALASAFQLVRPDGSSQDREAVLGWIRDAYGSRAGERFDIEVRNVEVRYRDGRKALVRYEEHQTTPDGETSRVSTVLLVAPAGSDRADADVAAGAPSLEWVDLHETWLDAPSN